MTRIINSLFSKLLKVKTNIETNSILKGFSEYIVKVISPKKEEPAQFERTLIIFEYDSYVSYLESW